MATRQKLKLKTFDITMNAVTAGIKMGLARHNKYHDIKLTANQHLLLEQELEREICNALCEVIDFEKS